jgi:hypothetical protein
MPIRYGTDVLAPDDPRHGKVAGYSAGCICSGCRKAKTVYEKHRIRQQAYGRWHPWVDAEPVRAHIRQLAKHNVGWEQVARLAGVAEGTVRNILRGRGGRPPARRCRPWTAEAILAVQPTLDDLSDYTMVDSTGTVRRLRALVALGRPMEHLGRMLPLSHEHVRTVIRRNPSGLVTAGFARAVRDLYEQLSMTVPPDTWVHRRAANFAARQGWVPPLAWDDVDIDDPQATPQVGKAADDHVDEIAVERGLRGQRVQLNEREKATAVKRGLARGMSRNAIAAALRLSGSKVSALAEEAGQPDTAETPDQATTGRRRQRSHTGTTCPSPDPARSDVAA